MVFVAAVSDNVGAPLYAVPRVCRRRRACEAQHLRLMGLSSARGAANGEVLTLHSGKCGRCARRDSMGL